MAIVAAVPTTVAAAALLITALGTNRKLKETQKTVAATHIVVNSRMTELIAVLQHQSKITGEAERAKGNLQGRAELAAEGMPVFWTDENGIRRVRNYNETGTTSP